MRVLCLFVCALIAMAMTGTAFARQRPAKSPMSDVRERGFAPVQAKCSGCHHPGGIGPFSLLTYRQTKGWGDDRKYRSGACRRGTPTRLEDSRTTG